MVSNITCLAEAPAVAYHSTKSDQTDQCIWWEEAQAEHEGLTECLELVGVKTRVDHVEEDGRCLRRARERVLDGAVFWVELCREVVVRDIMIARWE